MWVATWWRTACATATPSYEEVPRPSSSRMTSERGLASERIFLVSESSTKNVLCAAKMLSLAPRRDMMRSTGVSVAEMHGT